MRVSAANTGSIVTVAGALGVAVSAGSAGVGASIGVSVAISSIATTVRARVEDSVLRVANAGVTVKASDEASITAIAIGGAVAVQAGAAGVAIAVGTSVAVNKVFNTVEATVSGGRIETGGGKLTLSATQQADILSVVLGASVAVSAGSSANAAIGGGGALARNVISASVRAGISGAIIDTRASGGAAGAVDVLALGLSRINAVVLGMSASVSVSQYAAASASIGVAAAENVIGYDVNSAGQVVALGAGRPVNEIVAFIDRSAVTAGAVSVDARNVSFKANGDVDRKQSIDAVVVAGAVAVSVAYAPPVVDGASLAVSGAGAGARAVNKIQTGITARISDQNQQNRFEAGSVTVRALDQAEINSTIAAVAIAVAVSLGATAALSVAASLAQNEIGNTTLATMDGVRIAGAPAITVKADSQAAITTVSVAVSVSVGAGLGGVSLAGGGANARNLIGSSATALVNGSRIDGNAGNALNIDADMSGTIKATVVVASVGFTAAGASLAIGSALAENSITETAGARAGLTGSKLSNLGAVSVTADMQRLEASRGRRGGGGHGRRGAGRRRRGGLQHEQGGHPCLCGWPDPGRHRRARGREPDGQGDQYLDAGGDGGRRQRGGNGFRPGPVGGRGRGRQQDPGSRRGLCRQQRVVGERHGRADGAPERRCAGRQHPEGQGRRRLAGLLHAGRFGGGGRHRCQECGGGQRAGARQRRHDHGVRRRIGHGQETATVDSVSVAASAAVALTGVAVSGAGAGSSQVVANETGSRLTGSTVTAGTGVSVTAENTSTITAVTGAVAASVTGAGLGASMGVSIASNTFGAYSGDGVTRTNGAQAYIANSTVTVAKGNLDVLATSSETLNSVNFAGALAVVGAGVAVAGSGVQVSNRYASNTSAYIDGSTITVGIDGERGSLTVRARMTASSNARLPMAWRRRWPGARRQRVAGGVAGRHHGGKHRVGLYRHGRRQEVGAYDNLSVLALEKTQFKNLEAVTASVAASAGVAGAGAGVRVTNNTRNNVSARITGNGRGALGALAVKAATNVLAEIDLTQVSVAVGVIGAAVGVGIAENISRDTTTASVSEAQVSAPSVSVDALVAVDFSRTQTAGVAATTGLAVNVNKAKVDIGATTLAEARNGAVLNGVGVTTASGRTPGLVSVNAQGTYYGKAYSKAITGGVIGVGVMSAETVLQGSLKAVVDNASLRGDVVGVTARATTDRNGEAGLLAEARSLEVGGLTISVDSARLSTSLDARVEISNRAQIEARC